MRRIALVLLATVAVVSSASAQQEARSRSDFSLKSATSTARSSLTQSRTGPGGRLGYFFTDHLAVEGEGAWVPAKAGNGIDVSYIPLRAKLALNAAAREHVGSCSARACNRCYKRDYDLSDDGATGNVGFRLGLGE